jgi:hypothetical protein
LQLFTYAEAVLESVPAHLRNVKAYELQFVFHADGWFLVHCITTLLKNGKLKKPTDGQKKSLTTLIANVWWLDHILVSRMRVFEYVEQL